ncbi:MAG: hypothetical protein ACOYI2_10755 [Bacillota bacterium]|jgi:hypothetical protein|nr:hypothetical protein [Clostridia bacterium]
MGTCLCGCGGETKNNSKFIPGHDQKLRVNFEKSIGGVENLIFLKAIVDKVGQNKFLQHIKILNESKEA